MATISLGPFFNPSETAELNAEGLQRTGYCVELRALIAKDMDGLMMARRCISGDFIAHASYRVTGNAVAMGEAAGLVAEPLPPTASACPTKSNGTKPWTS